MSMSFETITIIDYGSGNLRSVAKAIEHVIANEAMDKRVVVTSSADDVRRADRIILPGQGAFGDCMDNLKNTPGMIDALERRVLDDKKPFLGICVGMQLLASHGLEYGEHKGLGWIKGTVEPLSEHINNPALKIPHMGWNVLKIPQNGAADNKHFILRRANVNAQSLDHYYFVHSFMFKCMYDHHVLGLVDYGGDFAVVVGRDNIIGVQFHPEKSQDAGLRLISDFLMWEPSL